jgi:site-specific DNA-methyltransferase (adenine-specific)
MNDEVFQAFLRIRDGYSPDAVIADPALNAQFLLACRELGAEGSDFELNHCLYNLRKSRRLKGYPTTRRVRLPHQDQYDFAAEIAARFLEYREKTTLDRVICDPVLAQGFDKLAQELAPGFTPFEYRFAALNLRKARRLRPEIGSKLLAATQVESFPVAGLDINRIPQEQGVYLFSYKDEGLLYLGEARNLRDRIRKHLDHSDRKDLARWLWEHGTDNLFVEVHVLPVGTANAARKAVELELIRSRRPRFNVLGADKGDE